MFEALNYPPVHPFTARSSEQLTTRDIRDLTSNNLSDSIMFHGYVPKNALRVGRYRQISLSCRYQIARSPRLITVPTTLSMIATLFIPLLEGRSELDQMVASADREGAVMLAEGQVESGMSASSLGRCEVIVEEIVIIDGSKLAEFFWG